MGDLLVGLPQKEKIIYHNCIKNLSKEEKQELWSLVKRVNKDGVVIIGNVNRVRNVLLQAELIVPNPFYKGAGYSFKVLPSTPYLLRRLQGINRGRYKSPIR